MAKKNTPQKSYLQLLFILLALSLFLFGTVIFKRNGSDPDVKGISTIALNILPKPPANSNSARKQIACNLSVSPPRTCPFGSKCEINASDTQKTGEGTCKALPIAKEGDACGLQRAKCRVNLACLPVNTPSDFQVISLSEGVDEKQSESCIGRTEEEAKKLRCKPFLPESGVCARQGVWQTLTGLVGYNTPGSTSPGSEGSCEKRPPCMNGIKQPNGSILYCDPKPGVTYCTPTPTRPIEKKTSPTPRPSCGGIAGTECPAGMYCKYDGNYPDATGTCILER